MKMLKEENIETVLVALLFLDFDISSMHILISSDTSSQRCLCEYRICIKINKMYDKNQHHLNSNP